MTKQTVAQKVAALTPAAATPVKQGRPARKLVSTVDIQRTCKDCGASFVASKNTYEDGSVLITPPRCKPCQTAHVTNKRVNKVILGFKHIGNLKSRLEPEQREAITDVLANELQVLLDVFAGNSVSVSGFDLKKI